MQQQQFAAALIPDDILRLAQEQRLGEPKDSYTIRALPRHWRWHYAIAFSALCLETVTLASAVIFVVVLQRSDSFSETQPIIDTLFALLGLLHFIFMLSLFSVGITNKMYRLYPCDEGFILKSTQKIARTIRWNEIESIWCSVAHVPFPARIYKIRCHDGYTLIFSGSQKGLAELDKTIEQQFTDRRLPGYLTSYKAGQTLKFGPLTLSMAGISKNDSFLPQEQIADIKLYKNRRLVIYSADNPHTPWLNISTWQIPDLVLFLALTGSDNLFQAENDERQASKRAQRLAKAQQRTILKVDNMPEEVAVLASEHKMGERRTDRRLGQSRMLTTQVLIAMAIGYLVILAFFDGTLYIFLNSLYTRPGLTDPFSNAMPYILRAELLLSLLFIFATFLPFFILNFRQRNWHVYTFEQGLILTKNPQALIICRWDEITTIWRASFIGKHPVYTPALSSGYTLQLRDGSRIVLSRILISQEAFGKIIREQVVPLQLPEVIAAYEAGQTLTFGPLHVNQEGIARGKRLLPWSQVKSVSLANNSLVIYNISKKSSWCSLPAARVPNLFVLFALADHVRAKNVSRLI